MIIRERLLSEYVNWRDYLNRNTILFRNDSVFTMLEIGGLSFETADDVVINDRHARLEATIRGVAQPGMIFSFLQCRGIAGPELYPQGRFYSEFAAQLDRRYRAKLFDNRFMWLNRTYLGIELPPRMIGGRTVNRLFRQRTPNDEVPEAQLERLHRVVGILCEELKDCNPRLLGVVKRGRAWFTEIAEAVAFAMTGYWREVPMAAAGANAVFSETVFVGPESFEVRMPHHSVWGACLGFDDFPFATSPGMFDSFLSANYRHTVFHGFRCLPAMDGLALATRKQNRMRYSGDRALSQQAELSEAADLIASNKLIVGEHAAAVTVFHNDRSRLNEVIQEAWGDLSSGGVKIERENIALEAVLFSQVPGNFHLRGRQAAVSSRNFAAFASMHNFPLGERKGFWGEPIAVLRTSGGTPFLLHLHVDGVGNWWISGQTGSGKSVLLGFLACQAQRSGAQVIIWDKDRGLEALVRALNGTYLSLTNAPGLGTGLAPLKRLTNGPEDLSFLSGLIRACISTPAPYDMTPEEDRRLGIALRHVMYGPSEDRSLSEVRAFLGTSRNGAGARLEKWCAGNEYGWIIDCEKDVVDLNNMVLGFDQSGLIEDKIASGAVLATLFHYTGKLVDGRRLIFLLDEIWNALLIDGFLSEINNGLKTFRKYNSPIIMGTQSVRDGLKSPIAHTIREQSPNQAYFANPTAIWADHGPDGMHLTQTEFEIVQRLPKGTGFFLLKQGAKSVVVQAPMQGMDEELAVISGTANGVRALSLARERTNDAAGTALVPAYLEALAEMEAAQ